MSDDQKKTLPVISAAALLMLPLTIVFGVTMLGTEDRCNPTGGSGTSLTVDPNSVPNTSIAGYGHEQLVNAAHIVEAGKKLGLNVRDQTIGVMTAMGESTLRVIDYGDGAGPDSRGLFQQRANGAWGSYADRMDPFISATNFFKAMMKVPERDSLEPTIVAHRTQINADPYHYTKFWDGAVQIVEGITGATTGLTQGTGGQVCNTGTLVPGSVGKDGWAKPGEPPVTSEYGPRPPIQTPAGLIDGFHTGLDLNAGGCDGPIWAANDGRVSRVFIDSLSNWFVVVDHGGGVATHYLHMYRDGILVKEGDKVKAGQQIARTGSSGASTACHLHFEVKVNGELVNPRDFLREVGINY